VFAGADGLESDEGDLHTRKRANGIPRRVGDVETAGESSHQDKYQGVQRNHVCDECVATCVRSIRNTTGQLARRTPSCHHVEIEKSGKGSEESAAEFERLDPAVECKHEEEDGDSFIVVGTSDGTRNVTRDNANERRSEETSTAILHLCSKPIATSEKCRNERESDVHIGGPCGQCAETRCQKYTNVPNVDGEVDCVQEIVNDTAGHH